MGLLGCNWVNLTEPKLFLKKDDGEGDGQGNDDYYDDDINDDNNNIDDNNNNNNNKINKTNFSHENRLFFGLFI